MSDRFRDEPQSLAEQSLSAVSAHIHRLWLVGFLLLGLMAAFTAAVIAHTNGVTIAIFTTLEPETGPGLAEYLVQERRMYIDLVLQVAGAVACLHLYPQERDGS